MPDTVSLSTLIRRTHLFLALFLTPWILMYAVSTLGMHHRTLFTGHEQRVDPPFDVISEQPYQATFEAGVGREEAARSILEDLDMEGAHGVQGRLEDGVLTIIRHRPIRTERVTYDAVEGTLRIERRQFAMVYFLEMLHRRRGFDQPFLANDTWAVIVDGVIVAILLWAATGLWMWWEMLRTRRLGAWCLVAGAALFAWFLLML